MNLAQGKEPAAIVFNTIFEAGNFLHAVFQMMLKELMTGHSHILPD